MANLERRNHVPEWDSRFYVTESKGNHHFHSYFREYFDKKPKQFASSFRITYANSTNDLPGITDVASRQISKTKEFKSLPMQSHQNVKKIMAETRAPIKKGQSKAFPSASKHFEMAGGWHNDFVVLHSRANQ